MENNKQGGDDYSSTTVKYSPSSLWSDQTASSSSSMSRNFDHSSDVDTSLHLNTRFEILDNLKNARSPVTPGHGLHGSPNQEELGRLTQGFRTASASGVGVSDSDIRVLSLQQVGMGERSRGETPSEETKERDRSAKKVKMNEGSNDETEMEGAIKEGMENIVSPKVQEDSKAMEGTDRGKEKASLHDDVVGAREHNVSMEDDDISISNMLMSSDEDEGGEGQQDEEAFDPCPELVVT
ncbi:uncharacterized protein G2W53_018520 [Senna tora]|uniref:Uncharacterized protein n=1 Tax=Senna tora TaxID=362788 RepID=A0A834TV93_9FABA|nr:uncharacterized protein G2W53_018520 [Senna tora]